MARVTWSAAAERDLSELIDRASRYNQAYALRLADRIVGKVRMLEAEPRYGREVAEYAMENLRELLVTPYRILYRVNDQAVAILGIFSAYQDLPAALSRRLPQQ